MLSHDQLRYQVIFHNYYLLVLFHLDLLYLSLIYFLVPNSDISQESKPSLLKLLSSRRLFLSVLMIMVFLVGSFHYDGCYYELPCLFGLYLKVVHLLLLRMECFLIFVVGALGTYYLMIEYLYFHLLSTYHSYLPWHLQGFENDLDILVGRFLFRMSCAFTVQYV